jgi:hypothetical protein
VSGLSRNPTPLSPFVCLWFRASTLTRQQKLLSAAGSQRSSPLRPLKPASTSTFPPLAVACIIQPFSHSLEKENDQPRFLPNRPIGNRSRLPPNLSPRKPVSHSFQPQTSPPLRCETTRSTRRVGTPHSPIPGPSFTPDLPFCDSASGGTLGAEAFVNRRYDTGIPPKPRARTSVRS